MLRIGIVAGEASGDYLAAGLLDALRRRVGGDLQAEGVAGPAMVEAGCRALAGTEQLSLIGLAEVVRHVPAVLRLKARLQDHFREHPPDVFVGVDAPDFTLSMETHLRRAGIPTVHYVSPTVWAWRAGRVHRVARAADRLLTLYPFEEELYRRQGVAVTYVGHPLADEIPREVDQTGLRRGLGLAPSGRVVAVLPGSRRSEVARLARPFVGAMAWLIRRAPDLSFVAPMATPAARRTFEAELARCGERLPVTVLDGLSREALGASDVALLACGTATLEALLCQRPMVAAYRVSPVSYALVKHMGLIRTRQYAMPNFLTSRPLVPELIQGAAQPSRLGSAVLDLLTDTRARQTIIEAFGRVHDELRQGASERAAEAVLEVAARDAPGRAIAGGSRGS